MKIMPQYCRKVHVMTHVHAHCSQHSCTRSDITEGRALQLQISSLSDTSAAMHNNSAFQHLPRIGTMETFEIQLCFKVQLKQCLLFVRPAVSTVA